MLSTMPMWAWNEPALPLVSSMRDSRCIKTVYQTQPVTGVDRGSDWNGGECAGFRGGAGVALDLTSMRMEGLPALLMLLRREFVHGSVRGRAKRWRALPPSEQALAMASMDDAVPI